MKKFKKTLCVVLSLVMLLSLTACGGNKEKADGGKDGGKDEGKANGVIVIGVKGDVTSLDPHKENDSTSAQAVRSIYETLFPLPSTYSNDFAK